jgi:hypothetical protein
MPHRDLTTEKTAGLPPSFAELRGQAVAALLAMTEKNHSAPPTHPDEPFRFLENAAR